jgi:hypothetical protein
MCPGTPPRRSTTVARGIANLQVMRAMVATRAASATFPETDHTDALVASDHSIDEVRATLAGWHSMDHRSEKDVRQFGTEPSCRNPARGRRTISRSATMPKNRIQP